MKYILARARVCGIAVLGGALAQGAAAQSVGGISYAPLGAQSVPTMSEWALILLAVALAALAYRATRGQAGRTLKVWAAGLLACATFAAAVWNQPAIATPLVSVLLDQAGGGTAAIPSHPDLYTGDFFHDYSVQNQTPQPQRITGISLNSGLSVPPSGKSPKCTVGLVLQPNDVCNVRVYKEPT